uniref:urocortin-2 n=1 Tax=Jaculus jaculus TaxID=51337 RepID=UPI0003334033|nr:urocortin-2 [Jaculus jaculus]
MTRWALQLLMVVMLGGVLVVPATPTPALQLLPQNCSQALPGPVLSDRPAGPSAARSHSDNAVSRLGPRITLSLDVPIGLLQILLKQARARAAREQATTNAHILAHVGRR